MFNIFNFWSPAIVGLDISATEVRLLHLSKAKTLPRIENFAAASLPADAIVDGHIQQSEAVLSVVRQLVQQTKTDNFPAALALPAVSILSKRIKLPSDFFDREREAEIAANLKNYFPSVTAELYFDFVTLGVIDKDYQEILVVAARVQQVNAYLSIAQQAGLKVKIVDVDLYAENRAQQQFKMHFAPHLSAVYLQSMATRLLVSYGLSLRRISRW